MLTKNVPVNLNEDSLACSLCTMHKYTLCHYTVLSNYYQTTTVSQMTTRICISICQMACSLHH